MPDEDLDIEELHKYGNNNDDDNNCSSDNLFHSTNDPIKQMSLIGLEDESDEDIHNKDERNPSLNCSEEENICGRTPFVYTFSFFAIGYNSNA